LCGESESNFKEGPYTKGFTADLAGNLASIYKSSVVLTGVYFNENKHGAAVYDNKTGAVHYIMAERVPGIYHGTGDLFASVLLAAILKGKPLLNAAEIAVDITAAAIMRTFNEKTDIRYGVNFEAELKNLAEKLN
jgi:pyridoxine kinase